MAPGPSTKARSPPTWLPTLRAQGGLHTEEDFARGLRNAEFVEPIKTGWRGMEVYQCPPNGSGMHVLQLLGILEGFETPERRPISAERYHRHIEAARLVYRDRDAFLADPVPGGCPGRAADRQGLSGASCAA